MTLHKTVRIVPQKEEFRTESVTCDLCGYVSKGAEKYGESVEWPCVYPDLNNIQTTAVEISEGRSYYDDGHKTVTSYHLCMACFKNKLEPWLKSQGAIPTVEEIDW